MKYGERIALLRTEAGLTQEELADKIGISRASLSHYEKNRREADYNTLIRFADFFDVSVDYIIGRTNNPISRYLTKTELAAFIHENVEDIQIRVRGKEMTGALSKKISEIIYPESTPQNDKEKP